MLSGPQTPSSIMQLPTPRRSNDSKVAGVAGGLAEALGIDPSFIRIGFAVLAITGGAGILLYLSAWLLMLPPPSGAVGTGGGEVGSLAQRPTSLVVLAGPVLTAAVFAFVISLNGLDVIPMSILFLLFGGIVLLNRRSDATVAMMAQPEPLTAPPPPLQPAPPPPMSFLPPASPAPIPETSAGEPSGMDETTVMEEPSGADETAVMDMAEPPVSPVDALLDELAFDHDWPAPSEGDRLPLYDPLLYDDGSRTHWALTKTAEETTLAKRQPDSSLPLASITLAAMAFLLGATLVSGTLFGAHISTVTVAGLATAAVGIAISISAFTGRTLRLIPIAILSLLVLLVSPIIDVAIDGGIGSRTITVTDVQNLRDGYSVGVGSLDLHLDELVITEDTVVEANVGIGQLLITVPAEVAVEVRGSTKAGYVYLLDRERAGVDVTFTRIPGGTTEGPTLIIEAKNTVGGIDVYRSR